MPKKSIICKHCLNFIQENDKNEFSCDFEHWEKETYWTAILNTPEMYGCIHFEYELED